MTDNIPTNAIMVTYNYGGGVAGSFHIWQAKDKWQWSALGANGEEASQISALTAARSWIKNSQLKKEIDKCQ